MTGRLAKWILGALVATIVLAATEAVAGYPRPSSASATFFTSAAMAYLPIALLAGGLATLASPDRGLNLWLPFGIGAARMAGVVSDALIRGEWLLPLAVIVSLALILGLSRVVEPARGAPPFLFGLTVGVVLPILAGQLSLAFLGPRLGSREVAAVSGMLLGLATFVLLRGCVARWPKAGLVFLVGPVASLALWSRDAGGSPPDVVASVATDRPDIVLIVLDTVRARSLSSYGHDRATMPHLEEFARGAATFTRAWTTGSWTLPAHASLFSGLRVGRHGYDSGFDITARLPPDRFLAERLRRVGYRTGAVSANFGVFGREDPLLRGFGYVAVEPLRPIRFRPWFFEILSRFPRAPGFREPGRRFPGPSMRAPWVVEKALEFWARPQAGPRFLFVNLMEAHLPWVPDPQDLGRFGPEGLGSEREQSEVLGRYLQQGRPTPVETDILRARYQESMYTLDRSVRDLLAGVTNGPGGERTIVVVTSDHGESLGEHDRFGHRNSLDEEVARIPLIVRAKDLGRAARINAPVQLVDVFGYLARSAGVAVDSGIDSVPFGERREVILEHRPGPQGALPSSYPRGDLYSLVVWPHKYAEGIAGPGQLFDLESDPEERNDLAPRQPALSRALSVRLRELVSASHPASLLGEMDPTTEERLRALGYVR